MGQRVTSTDPWPMWPTQICWPTWPVTRWPIVISRLPGLAFVLDILSHNAYVFSPIMPSLPHHCYHYHHHHFLPRECDASVVLAMALCPSVRPSVCPSVTSRSSTKTAKHRITQTTPHDSPGTLVFWCQWSLRNSTGVNPYAKCAPNTGWVS